MDLLNDKIKKVYLKYLSATLGSTLLMSIYALVDTIVIGHYEGPNGTAAIATFSPLWTLLFAFGLLFGIGGSVYMAQKNGEGNKKEGNKYFTISLVLGIIISLIIFILYNFLKRPLLEFTGGRNEVLELAIKYSHWIAIFSPLFILGQCIIPFIRNDGSPLYTTIAVVIGGVFNIFGDIFFVYTCNMGIEGAGLATALGQIVSFIIIIAYFFRKSNGLKIIKDIKQLELLSKSKEIILMGGSNFIIDIAMGVLAVIFNNQIMKYLGTSALSVYGVIVNVSTMVQTLAYAVGESSQAIMSINYGAKKINRVRETFRYATITSFIIGIICFVLGEIMPNIIIKAFMSVSPEILEIAPTILRLYFIAFILLVFNVFSTYYFQSILKPKISFVTSLMRGIIVSGLFIYVLPIIFGGNSIWLAVPLAELITFIYVIININKSNKEIVN